MIARTSSSVSTSSSRNVFGESWVRLGGRGRRGQGFEANSLELTAISSTPWRTRRACRIRDGDSPRWLISPIHTATDSGFILPMGRSPNRGNTCPGGESLVAIDRVLGLPQLGGEPSGCKLPEELSTSVRIDVVAAIHVGLDVPGGVPSVYSHRAAMFPFWSRRNPVSPSLFHTAPGITLPVESQFVSEEDSFTAGATSPRSVVALCRVGTQGLLC